MKYVLIAIYEGLKVTAGVAAFLGALWLYGRALSYDFGLTLGITIALACVGWVIKRAIDLKIEADREALVRAYVESERQARGALLNGPEERI